MAAVVEGGRETRTRRQTRKSAPGATTPTAPAAEIVPPATPKRPASTRRRQVARIDRPAVALCLDLEGLRALTPEAARAHVDTYLHAVMRKPQADAFEALSFRWELHLVELDQLCLLRGVDLSQRKLGHYRTVLRKHGGFPPLIGLGGDGNDATRGVLLCDGYHRAIAMRDLDIHFAWVWLAVGPWVATPIESESESESAFASSRA